MRIFIVSLCALAMVVLAGCGGGVTSTTLPFSVQLDVPNGTTSSGGTPTITEKAADSFSPSLEGSAFVAAATCEPVGTEFSQPVTLTFNLTSAVESGKTVNLFKIADNGDITQVSGSTVTLSADRKIVTAQVTKFTDNGIFMVLIVP